MKPLFLAFWLLCVVPITPAFSQHIAVCGEVAGTSYHPFSGNVPQDQTGWTPNGISKGKFTLMRLAKDKYDFLFLDATGAITSAVHDGGSVIKMRQGKNNVTFLVGYPEGAIEVRTFLIDLAGTKQVIYLASKGGDHMPIQKGSLFAGDRETIQFD